MSKSTLFTLLTETFEAVALTEAAAVDAVAAEAVVPSAEVVASVEAEVAGDDASRSSRPGSGRRSTSATCSADGPTASATTTASREIPATPLALQGSVPADVCTGPWKGTLPATGGAPSFAASAWLGRATRVQTTLRPEGRP